MINKLIRFCLENKLVVVLFTTVLVLWGLMVAPFDWEFDHLPRDPVPVDAIPDVGENQQIVFTEWPGRSPRDVEDQVTFPLTTALLGLPQVKTVRSSSMFGFSSIYVIFKEDSDFYWSRSRILEKLNSLPSGTLPEGAAPRLGPDATALGQVFWYTLEGRDAEGNPTGGWDPQELRSAQDWYVRYALQGAEGVAEVASVGGFVKEYQVDVDPEALRAYDIGLHEVFDAVRNSNLDVGARTIEVNAAEYVVRGLGFVESLEDLSRTVITQRDHVPVTLDQVAELQMGPAQRRGALDKAGAEAVGGVVVARYGENPLAVIQAVKDRIESVKDGMPSKTLEDGTVSRVEIVPFYDRAGLIYETLGTLESAVRQQILVTVIVVVVMVLHLRSAFLISAVLPLAVLCAFIGMSLFGVDANVVALSGIAIAIGTIVDMGIVLTENILKHLDEADPDTPGLEVVYGACAEVGGAVVTAVLTTIVSFLPVFTMQAAEGKLFKPLAYTKTFALAGSILVALTLLPPLAHVLLGWKRNHKKHKRPQKSGERKGCVQWLRWLILGAFVLVVVTILARDWAPVGPQFVVTNLFFVLLSVGGLLGFFYVFIHFYPRMLAGVLRFKSVFLLANLLVLVAGGLAWRSLGREFMPDLDEGSFLYMPTTMPHASIGEVMEVMSKQDMAITAIPEVESAVGKLGRVDSPLDPAPVSMIETIITYKPEFKTDKDGRILRFAYDEEAEAFARDGEGALIPDAGGRPYRQWREEIESPDDIWEEIVRAAQMPGTTSAPKLQPIAARRVMLQSGMRAPMGMKVFGPDLERIEEAALALEAALKEVPSIRSEAVTADRVVGKPYLEIDIDRDAIARYGLTITRVQDVIQMAIGGKTATRSVEGRERYPIRVRYLRELRDSIESIGEVWVSAPDGTGVPLRELAEIRTVRGPQAIKSEDTFLLGYVIFDKREGFAEVEVVEEAQALLDGMRERGELELPEGVTYEFTGSYENQLRAAKRLRLVVPLSLFIIWLILYFQFRHVGSTLLVFSGIAYAWAGGFILLWLYGQGWFLDFGLWGHNLRDLFQVGTVNLSVAVWVGFLALFGIATDDGVLMTTYLRQRFAEAPSGTPAEIRARVVEAASRRVRPAMMTSATTLLALLPVLTSTGRGSDIMVPMAIPTFGGMLLALVTVLVVPTLYCAGAEMRLNLQNRKRR